MRSERMNMRIDVYGKTQTTNELGETDYTYSKLKSIWAEIIPETGSVISGEGTTTYADIRLKVMIRKNSIIGLTNDMYFMFNGQRYNIKYFNPNYKRRDSIEIMCSLVVE